MPNCDFYALAADLRQVLDFLFEQPGWELLELASAPGKPLRVLRSTEALVAACPGFSNLSPGHHFQLYSDEMGGPWKSREIRFTGAIDGEMFRYESAGWGLIQLYFGQLRSGTLSPSHTNHNSEKRARAWAETYSDPPSPDAWNWKEVGRISGKLIRFIRSLAAGKYGSRVVLPEAKRALDAGELKLALAW